MGLNTGKVASFIDDIIVKTETEKEYNKIVEEIVRKLVDNYLYVKPEKYRWKVRKIGFLGVVIGPEGIRIEEEKVKDILYWLTLKGVRDVQKFLGLVNYYH